MPSSHWGRKTRSAVALEAAVVWSELPEENPGCSSGIAHQPKKDRRTQMKDSSISSGLRVQVNVYEDIKGRVSGQKPLGTTVC